MHQFINGNSTKSSGAYKRCACVIINDDMMYIYLE